MQESQVRVKFSVVVTIAIAQSVKAKQSPIGQAPIPYLSDHIKKKKIEEWIDDKNFGPI